MDTQAIYQFLDPFLVWAFRLPGDATLGFALGLVWIALVATAIGELCIAGAYFINRKHFRSMRSEMVSNHNLSIQALLAKDKDTYKACNGLANEAFGKTFFSNIALFAASLWPAFFALGWLGFRFNGVEFSLPLLGIVTTNFFFVPTYIATRILFSRVKKRLPVFKQAHALLKDEDPNEEKLVNYLDYMKDRDDSEKRGENTAAA
ncbi:hypothetical protein DPQ33_12465 [Oceanidesulfovibrio indonesiensis]|uniref:Uncharacterized protein n=1 Tax=Oceanidesulfovibrio indonesiensis TaxID=54767 RepID=A0A7M3MD62_9BACT|nr:hypothetical protein [Oceanidesulfovibrio indonesiensis]TVM16425.1 hypothetical protein DPQ33_12465 [Oceanidesulfovibrio indonesiensis]